MCVSGSYTRLLRMAAILLLLSFSLTSTRALTLVPMRCTSCPPDCPMHSGKRGCHHGAAQPDVNAARRGPGQFHEGPGLRCAGCTHHDGVELSDEPVVLPAPASIEAIADGFHGLLPRLCPPKEAALDPPFHPPRSITSVV